MKEEEKPTQLQIHTLETLGVELVSGRKIALDAAGATFQLLEPRTRSLFNWYRKNSHRWAGNVRKEDVEALVDCLDEAPPEIPLSVSAAPGSSGRLVCVSKIQIHNFGGIHVFPSAARGVSDFTLALDSRPVLIEGANGSGKTSILSALCWALTGKIYRSQRPPEIVSDLIAVEPISDSGAQENYVAPITPIPPADALEQLGGKPVPLDTWVELAFTDSTGAEIGKLRRTLTRNARGKVEIVCSDTSFLGLDPIAIEIGTSMPGLIPYIALGEKSELGKAISKLTGIQPLENLTSHAGRVSEKLRSDLPKERQAEIAEIDKQYIRARTELLAVFAEFPSIKPKTDAPLPGADKEIETKLDAAAAELGALQASAYADARTILGDQFDPGNADLRRDLGTSVPIALASIEGPKLAALSSAHRLVALRSLTESEVEGAEELIATLLQEAEEIAEVSASPHIIARRLQLYARIANWIREGEHGEHVAECPVCRSALEGKTDQQTGQLVAKHIQDLLSQNKAYLEKTVREWINDASRRLSAGLCKTLQAEIHGDLPTSPADLIRDALCDELLANECFRNSLRTLKESIKALAAQHLRKLPPFVEPEKVSFPSRVSAQSADLIQKVWRVRRALAFADWRKANAKELQGAFSGIVGDASAAAQKADRPERPVGEWTLAERLHALNRLVTAAKPISEALNKLGSMKQELARRRAKEQRIAKYAETALAIQPLTSLKILVDKQVTSLMNQLGTRTAHWRSKLYRAAYVGGPEFVESSIDVDGAISIDVASGGTKVSAQHVANASDLRATLLAFLLSFWEHLHQTRGALATILLDDLQELFDPHNRQRVAAAIADASKAGAHSVVTTNDQEFGRKVVTAMQSQEQALSHLHIHPLSNVRSCVVLSPFEEEIDKKRRSFEHADNQNQDQPARDYVKDVRIYMESRLLDLFADGFSSLPAQPGLADLINAVRQARLQGRESIASKAFKNLVDEPALKHGSDFLNVINQSHHGREALIRYNDVYAIRDDCIRARKLVDAAYAEFWMWMRRDATTPRLEAVRMPQPMHAPIINAPILSRLAAFAGSATAGDGDGTAEALDGKKFQNKAIYYLKTNNFGFSGLGNCRAVVSLDEVQQIADNSLVIAHVNGKVVARRVLRSSDDTTKIALGSEVEDPTRRPPTMIVATEGAVLLPVVGIVFDDSPNYSRNQDEATLEDSSAVLDRVKAAFRVVGDSALPLALPGQLVLGGDHVVPNQLDKLVGEIVAIATSDGEAYLKRIGAAVPGAPHVRMFEAVGGRGISLLLKTEDVSDGIGSLPLLMSCRRVMGVLY